MGNLIQARRAFTVQTRTGPEDFDNEREAATCAALVVLGLWDEDICDAVRINMENNLDDLQVYLKKMSGGSK